MLPRLATAPQQITSLSTKWKGSAQNLRPLMHHRIRQNVLTQINHLSPWILLAAVTDLCASRREGAGRAWEDPGVPGTGRGWSTGCLVEKGSLMAHKTHHTSHSVALHKAGTRHQLVLQSHDYGGFCLKVLNNWSCVALIAPAVRPQTKY